MQTIKHIVKCFPRCTKWMVINYRWKTGAGTRINNKIYFSDEEVNKFIDETDGENIKLRDELYEFIKFHPGLKESNLYNHLGSKFTKHRTANLLADISFVDDYPQFVNLYEDDDDTLYIEGFEINLNKKYDRRNGLFY